LVQVERVTLGCYRALAFTQEQLQYVARFWHDWAATRHSCQARVAALATQLSRTLPGQAPSSLALGCTAQAIGEIVSGGSRGLLATNVAAVAFANSALREMHAVLRTDAEAFGRMQAYKRLRLYTSQVERGRPYLDAHRLCQIAAQTCSTTWDSQRYVSA
jgi:hypothetical protein